MKIKNLSNIHKTVFVFSFLFIIGLLIGGVLTRQNNKKDSGEILEAATAIPSIVTIDYSKKIVDGSPLVFGGAHNPSNEQQLAWDALQEIGVTSIRRDFFIEYELPDNYTIEDYKNNVGDIQNPEKWRMKTIRTRNEEYDNARNRGMKVIAILAYAPKWLTYSGSTHGVPKDWDVYEDIVKKLYKLHRNHIDFLEIWNEPTYKSFLDVSNSPYTQEEAYINIYKHAVRAIKAVEAEINDGRHIPIIGFSAHTPNEASMLDRFLADQEVLTTLNYLSLHNYEHKPEPSWSDYLDIMTRYGVEEIPIMITEWSHFPNDKNPDPYNSSDLAIAYTGSKLIDYLKMGVAGANYFATIQANQKRPNNGFGTYGMYTWENGRPVLRPQAKTWRLLSRQLKLGKGQSTMVKTAHDAFINAVGFINTDGEVGFAIVNENYTNRLVTVKLMSAASGKHLKIITFEASAKEDGKQPKHDVEVDLVDGDAKLDVLVPAESVVGVIAQPLKRWYEVF